VPEDLPPLVVVAGATASGKTALALAVAEGLAARGIPAEIISADSRQVYRGMDIGTAKATPEERARVPHHGLDLVDPDQPFSVADFADHVSAALAGISERGAVAILAGGTGFYLRAIARGLAVDELPYDTDIRADIEATLVKGGLPGLVKELRHIAPTRAAAIDLHNPRRVVRALEIARIRGDVPLPEPRGYGRAVLWLGLLRSNRRSFANASASAPGPSSKPGSSMRRAPSSPGSTRHSSASPVSATRRHARSWTVA
jgi:tRNA dimethylallyltransferase